MMHRCNSSQGNNMAGMGSCNSCDLFLHNNQSNDRNYNQQYDYYHDQVPDMYNQFTSSSSVDCTLSLGTPSTRLSGYDYDYNYNYNYNYNDKIIQHEDQYSSSTSNRNTTSRGALHNNTGNNKNDEDHLLARRRCANCDTTSTPLWRNGPRGPKSLCNACGIRFKKEERRARAAASANSMNGISESQTQKMQCFNEFKFMDEDNEEQPETGISLISSWHLNVADRSPSFVHDFTRS